MVGSGADDATEYDLVDCVYPHIPAGADSPAAAAINRCSSRGARTRRRINEM
ncbi:hypothetical protein ACWC0C_46165 [Streptomyces sp. NPDC001709]